MAQLNPSVNPTSDPNYLGMSRTPEPNRAFEEALKGVGRIFEGAVQGVDTIIKQGIEKEAYNAVDPQRAGFIQGLDTIKAAGPKATLATTPGESAPTDLQSGLRTVERLHTGAEHGHYDRSYYLQRLDRIAQQLRHKYPGYRAYIDQTIAGITGGNPANDYIREMLGAINRDYAGSRSALLAQDRFFQQHIGKVPGLQAWYDNEWRSGKADPAEGRAMIAKWEEEEAKLKRFKLQAETGSAVRSEDKVIVSRAFEHEASLRVRNFMDEMFSGYKLSDGTEIKTLADAVRVQQEVATNKRQIPTADLISLGNLIRSKTQELEMRLRSSAKTVGKSGLSDEARMGGAKEVNASLDELLKPLRAIAEHTSKGEITLAATTAAVVKGMENEETLRMYNDRKIGDFLRRINALRGMGPEYLQYVVQEALTKPIGTDSRGRITTIKSEIVAAVTEKTARMAAPDPGAGKDGRPPTQTLDSSLDEIRRGVRDPKSSDASGATNLVIDNVVKTITAPIGGPVTDDIKINMVRSTFHPNNYAVMSKIQPDGYDENTRRTIPGQYSKFRDLTSPQVTSEVNRLAAKAPEIKQMYLNTTETWFNHMFRRDFLELKNLTENTSGRIQVDWDDKNTKFILRTQAAGAVDPNRPWTANLRDMGTDTPGLAKAHILIGRINGALDTLKGAHKVADKEPDAFLIESMLNVVPDLATSRNRGTIADNMMNALITARTQKLFRERKGSDSKKLQPATE